MKFFFLIFFSISCYTPMNSQCHDTCVTCTIKIDYTNFGINLPLKDSIIYNQRTYTSDTFYIFYKIDCFGTLKLYKYEENKLAVYGEYKGLDNLLEESIILQNGFTGTETKSTSKSYKPVKHGKWIFSKPNGMVYREEYWEDGVLIKIIDK